MKIGIVTESDVDAAAIRVLISAFLGKPALPVDRPGLRTRSWPGILRLIRPVYLELYYHTDSDGLVLVADADFSPTHQLEHEDPGKLDANCRLCEMRRILREAAKFVRSPRPCQKTLFTAVGLTIPEISAWYRFGEDPGVNEAAWVNGQKMNRPPYSIEELKRAAFGSAINKPRDVAIAHATRITKAMKDFERAFPIGFGSLANDLRTWRSP